MIEGKNNKKQFTDFSFVSFRGDFSSRAIWRDSRRSSTATNVCPMPNCRLSTSILKTTRVPCGQAERKRRSYVCLVSADHADVHRLARREPWVDCLRSGGFRFGTIWPGILRSLLLRVHSTKVANERTNALPRERFEMRSTYLKMIDRVTVDERELNANKDEDQGEFQHDDDDEQ